MPGFRRRLIVNGEASPRRHPLEGDVVKGSTFVPVRFRQRGQHRVAIAPPGVDTPMMMPTLPARPTLPKRHDPALLKALARGFYWQHLIDTGVVMDAGEIAKREGVHRVSVNELLRMARLAPSIVEAVMAGQLAQTVSRQVLVRAAMPRGWDAQRAELNQ